MEKPFVCTLLIGLEPSDVSGPLAQFQHTKPTKDDLLQLMKTLNKALGENAIKDAQVHAAFELCWPKLEEKLHNLPIDGPTNRPHRSERDLLEELVDTVRSTSAQDALNLSRIREELEEVSDRLEDLEHTVPKSGFYGIRMKPVDISAREAGKVGLEGVKEPLTQETLAKLVNELEAVARARGPAKEQGGK